MCAGAYWVAFSGDHWLLLVDEVLVLADLAERHLMGLAERGYLLVVVGAEHCAAAGMLHWLVQVLCRVELLDRVSARSNSPAEWMSRAEAALVQAAA